MRRSAMACAVAFGLSAAVTGCGKGSTGITRDDVAAFWSLAGDLGTAAAAYGTTAAATLDPAGCTSARAAYHGRVHPMIDSMQSTCDGMDDQMGRMGNGGWADLRCAADAMAAELSQHDAAACATTAMAVNHAEAARHVAAMIGWASHQRDRASLLDGMMGGDGMGRGMGGGGMMDPGALPTMACHRNGDGTFTYAP